ncbi:MAG: rhodanese-like domain-containing protein [Acidobacteria bacterium]|nr:rhodanese-like domain-containing protein [Acidobacteriota bacterium]MCA1627614.1 rhodanese-like domain-containing protein [Acidobacteriota bacterium]
MRLFTYSISVLLLATLFACNALDSKTSSQAQKSTPTPTPHPEGARRINIDELEALLKEGKAFVVDVRSQDAYDVGHIPGAKLIPVDVIGSRTKELPSDKLIVTYCS